MRRFGVDDLALLRACSREVKLFRDTFGESADLSRENLIKAALAGLNVSWLAIKILEPGPLRCFEARWNPAEDAYIDLIYRTEKAYYSTSDFLDYPTFLAVKRGAESALAESLGDALADALGLD